MNVVVFPQLRRHGMQCACSRLLQLLKLLMVLTCKLGDKVNYFVLYNGAVHEKFLDNKPELSSADCSFVLLLSCHVQYSARNRAR